MDKQVGREAGSLQIWLVKKRKVWTCSTSPLDCKGVVYLQTDR